MKIVVAIGGSILLKDYDSTRFRQYSEILKELSKEPELLRFVGMPDAIAANMRQIIYGLVLIAIMFLRPQGLLGENSIK